MYTRKGPLVPLLLLRHVTPSRGKTMRLNYEPRKSEITSTEAALRESDLDSAQQPYDVAPFFTLALSMIIYVEPRCEG